MNRLPAILLTASAAALLSGAALAQGVMPVAPMPMPPSARDAPPKVQAAPRSKPSKRARPETAGEQGAAAPTPRLRSTSQPAFRSTTDGRMSDQIDTRRSRPGSGGIELEDDPRAVVPTMQNGRPGMGMRF